LDVTGKVYVTARHDMSNCIKIITKPLLVATAIGSRLCVTYLYYLFSSTGLFWTGMIWTTTFLIWSAICIH